MSTRMMKMVDKVLVFAFYSCIGLLQYTTTVAADEGTYYNPARASKSLFCSDLNAQNSLDIDFVSMI